MTYVPIFTCLATIATVFNLEIAQKIERFKKKSVLSTFKHDLPISVSSIDGYLATEHF